MSYAQRRPDDFPNRNMSYRGPYPPALRAVPPLPDTSPDDTPTEPLDNVRTGHFHWRSPLDRVLIAIALILGSAAVVVFLGLLLITVVDLRNADPTPPTCTSTDASPQTPWKFVHHNQQC